MSNETRLHGYVAAVLNRRELVLNIGEQEGVRLGMKFAVLNRAGLDVRDPETGESLGTVEVPKSLVEVVRVQPRLAVGRTFRTETRNIGGTTGISSRLFDPPKYVEIPETLDVAEKPYEEELSEEDSVVKIGDPVVQVLADEFL